MSVTQLGGTATVFFASTALISVPAGRLAGRSGAKRVLRVAVTIAAASLAGAALSQHWWHITAAMALAGSANGLAEPAANLAIAVGVERSRQGVSFGFKQSAAPATTLLAGFSLPMLGLTVGWRWTFATAALLSVAVVLLIPTFRDANTGTERRARQHQPLPVRPLVVLTCAFGFGTASATAAAAFLVATAVEDGFALSRAGLLLAVASSAAILARWLAGWSADRSMGGHLPMVAGMAIAGGIGMGLLAVGSVGSTVVGGILAFGFGWGWTGLLILAVSRLDVQNAGTSTGILLLGGATGAAVGPSLFGLVVDATAFKTAWLLTAAGSFLTAVLCMVGWWLLRGNRTNPR